MRIKWQIYLQNFKLVVFSWLHFINLNFKNRVPSPSLPFRFLSSLFFCPLFLLQTIGKTKALGHFLNWSLKYNLMCAVLNRNTTGVCFVFSICTDYYDITFSLSSYYLNSANMTPLVPRLTHALYDDTPLDCAHAHSLSPLSLIYIFPKLHNQHILNSGFN